MIIFDKIVDEALKNQPSLTHLRAVVEKELLHHDILLVMRNSGFLKKLTFIGGTCLRSCYGGIRLSEDLDFTGDFNFNKESLSTFSDIIKENLFKKYGLHVSVTEPKHEKEIVDTWKIKIETRPESKNLPSQRINLDICALKSYDVRPIMLLNPYGVDLGTSGLIIRAQSLEEIYADKLIAFALRENRIKYRDIWDIGWCHGKNIKPKLDLIPFKIKDRKVSPPFFLEKFEERAALMENNQTLCDEFKKEMSRFLTTDYTSTSYLEDLWQFTTSLIKDFSFAIKALDF